jgi:ubiquinone/menaquinone biosynthesis C-methylase UbiE
VDPSNGTRNDPSMDNQSYYDDFSDWYDRERGHGYHKMLDDLEVALVERYGRGAEVLEVGCGTGLLLDRVRQFASKTSGMDLSAGMLSKARDRGLEVIQGSATALPYADNSFDVTYSFKVLPHVADIRTALSEMARVTRPGGFVLPEFYNPRSLRYLVKSLKPPTKISDNTDDEAVYTRYDTVERFKSYLPPELEWKASRGVRIVTPVSYVHKVPALGKLVRIAEEQLADMPFIRNFGGFLIGITQKR